MEKIQIQYGNAPSQFGVLRVPGGDSRFPVVVTIHGGFWQSKYNLEENNPIVEDITQRGFATWNIEYRRVGEQGGGWPGTFSDVIQAINYIQVLQHNYPLDTSNLIILGHSAGGHLALWVASRSIDSKQDDPFKRLEIPIKKVVSLAGVTNLKEMWKIHQEEELLSPVSSFMGGTPDEVTHRYHLASPTNLLPLNVDQVLIHGGLDRHVPVSLSKNYYELALEKGENIRLFILPEVEHFKIINPTSEAWKTVIEVL